MSWLYLALLAALAIGVYRKVSAFYQRAVRWEALLTEPGGRDGRIIQVGISLGTTYVLVSVILALVVPLLSLVPA